MTRDAAVWRCRLAMGRALMVTKGEDTAREEIGAEGSGVGFTEKLKRSALRTISKY